MAHQLQVRAERLPLRAPFRISRGAKTHAEVVVAELGAGGALGRGEAAPYGRYGESLQSVTAQLGQAARRLADGEPPGTVVSSLPPGAARNALDCALWDLQARRTGVSVAERLGVRRPDPLVTAVTVSLDAPRAMADAAAAVAGAPLLKVKLAAEGSAERLRAVAAAAPGSRLILDPNESWTIGELVALAPLVASLPVAFVEQPLPQAEDAALEGLGYPVPICADESVHRTADLPRLVGRYGMVNVKLDKAGGLTETLAMARQARAMGFSVLAGCMVASSLAIAPALFVGAVADHADLDGPWWLADDRPGGCRVEDGRVFPPSPGFWGEAA